nr:hypothetical protein [Tanacetum cinerariifolium]
MHFLLSSMSVMYVLTTPMPEDEGDNPTVKQVRKRAKWDNDDYVCRGLILNVMSDSLFDIYQNVKTSKELWDTLEAKYMDEDASSKKFLVSNFTNYKMTDSRPVLEHYNELLGILEKFTQHKMNMDESIQDDDVTWWVDSEATVHVCKDRRWFKIYESLNDRSILHMRNESTALVHKRGCVDLRLGYVHFIRIKDMSMDGLIPAFDMDTEKCERGIECIFVGYVEHSKAFRFYVIEPNDSVAINSIVESKDAIFDENRFSSVLIPSQRSLVNRSKDIGGSVVPEKVTEEVVQQPEPKLKKSKRHRTPKDFGLEFQLYLIERTKDEKKAINDEIDSIMGNNTWLLTDLPPGCRPLGCKWIFKIKLKVDKTVEKFKERLVIQGFRQKLWIDYFDTYAQVVRISTIRLLIAMASIYSLIIHQMDVKTTFLNDELKEEAYMNQPQGFIMPDNKNKICKLIKSLYGLKQIELTNKFLSSRFSMKGMGEADVILVSTHIDTSEKLMSNNGQAVSQLEYTSNHGTQHWQAIQRVLKYLKKTKNYRLIYIGYPLVLEGYTDASWISNTEDNSSTSGWYSCLVVVLFLGLSRSKLVSLDSAATLAKAYSHMYNGKSRYLGVRHSMIRELITNGVVFIEFMRSQQNLVDHLTKGLARDLVIKSAKGMGLKSNQVTEC